MSSRNINRSNQDRLMAHRTKCPPTRHPTSTSETNGSSSGRASVRIAAARYARSEACRHSLITAHRQCFRTVKLGRFVVLRWARGDTGNSVKHVDELIDDLVYGQRKMAVQPCHADLLCSSDESVRFEPQLLRWG
jgi:hypothetical protein